MTSTDTALRSSRLDPSAVDNTEIYNILNLPQRVEFADGWLNPASPLSHPFMIIMAASVVAVEQPERTIISE